MLLLPAGLVCVGFPIYRLTFDGGWAIVDDTRAAFGGGSDAGHLKANSVDCTSQRSGSSSSRSIGMTEYDCVIDLGEANLAAGVPTDDPWEGRTWEEGMAESNRRLNAQIGAMAEQSRGRSHVSNRIERKLASDRSGDLPAVRILSAKGEPRRVGLVWGFGELAWRWGQWLVISLLFFAFGGGCLYAVWVAWIRPAKNGDLYMPADR